MTWHRKQQAWAGEVYRAFEGERFYSLERYSTGTQWELWLYDGARSRNVAYASRRSVKRAMEWADSVIAGGLTYDEPQLDFLARRQ